MTAHGKVLNTLVAYLIRWVNVTVVVAESERAVVPVTLTMHDCSVSVPKLKLNFGRSLGMTSRW